MAAFNIVLQYHWSAIDRVEGELIVAGWLSGLSLPQGVKGLSLEKEAKERRRGQMRNVSIARSTGNLILTADTESMLAPYNWTEAFLDWAEMIDSRVPYVAGFQITSLDGKRLLDWVKVAPGNRLLPLDYGELSTDLAIGGGVLGLSRSAWERSNGFGSELQGHGEDIEFSHRCGKEKIPLIFCDKVQVVRLSALSESAFKED